MYDVRDIANFILDRADKGGIEISNLSLQKLLYFIHGWFFAIYDEPLVRNKFEAWKFGPVQRVLYEQFKSFGSSPIIERRAGYLDPLTGKLTFRIPEIDQIHAAVIDSVLQKYSRFTANQLVQMSHVEDGPWEYVWKQAEDQVYLGMQIPNELIRKHFKSLRPLLTFH